MTFALRALPFAGLAAGTGVLGATLLIVLGASYSPLVALIVAIFLAIGAVVVVYVPALSYVAMALVVPLERVGRFGDDLDLQTFSVMRLVGLGALVAVFAQMLIRRQPIEVPRALVLYGLFVAMALGSVLYADDPVATEGHAITMVGNFLMLFVLVQGVRDWSTVRLLTLVWLFATVLIGLYQIYTWHFQIELSDPELGLASQRLSTTYTDLSELSTLGEVRRAIGTTSNPAVYGINLLLALPFVFWRLRVAPTLIWRTVWLVAAAVVLYNIMLTNTRAVFLFAAVLLLLIIGSGLLRMTVSMVAGVLAAGVVVLFSLPASIWSRVLNPSAYDLSNATNLSWRFDLWAAALRIGTDHWLTGIGVGNRTAIIPYLDPTRFDAGWIMAHNEFLQVFYELGLFGLLIFVAFLVTLLWRTWVTAARLRRLGQDEARWFAVAAGLSLFIGIVFSLQVDAFHFPLKGWWLAAGLVVVLDRLSKTAQIAPMGQETA